MQRSVSLVVLALLVSGCLGAPGASTVEPSPQSPTDASPTDTPGTATSPTPVCERVTVPTVDPVRESVRPRPLPDRPASLNASSAEQFARAYERAYKRNVGLTRTTTQYEVTLGESQVRAVPGGYVVTVDALYWFNEAGFTEGTVTPTVIHGDGPPYTAAYFVGQDRVRRDTTLSGEALRPRQGRIVECWSADS